MDLTNTARGPRASFLSSLAMSFLLRPTGGSRDISLQLPRFPDPTELARVKCQGFRTGEPICNLTLLFGGSWAHVPSSSPVILLEELGEVEWVVLDVKSPRLKDSIWSRPFLLRSWAPTAPEHCRAWPLAASKALAPSCEQSSALLHRDHGLNTISPVLRCCFLWTENACFFEPTPKDFFQFFYSYGDWK